MTKDLKTGECYRLDHLIKAHLEKLASEKTATAELKDECADIVIKVRKLLQIPTKSH
jgi:glycyl-tRNA synthetase